jgi:hypothetical protein
MTGRCLGTSAPAFAKARPFKHRGQYRYVDAVVPITKHIAPGCRGKNRLAKAALDEGSPSLPRPCVGPESHPPEGLYALLALNPLRAFAVALLVTLLYNRPLRGRLLARSS